jgi:hypothetical protein
MSVARRVLAERIKCQTGRFVSQGRMMGAMLMFSAANARESSIHAIILLNKPRKS